MTLLTRALLLGCDRVGARPVLEGRPWIENSGRIVLGDDVFISSLPVQSHLIARRGFLEIGSSVRIGQGAAISAHEHIRVGDGTVMGAYVTIADTDFHVAGDRNAEPQTSPVILGRNVRIGHRVTILRGTQIGDGAQILAGSVVAGCIEANLRVGGVPARGSPARETSGYADADEVVPGLVQRVLGLHERPAPGDGPERFEQWDSLGSLKLLIALEEEFAISLREDEVGHARSVAALIAAVHAARMRGP